MLSTKDEVIISPGKAELNYWKDIWRFRELFYILSWRDIKVRYKQTVIGAAWSIIRLLLFLLSSLVRWLSFPFLVLHPML
jgi:lipopolysaccharide transport system permease protein